jgi:gamma-glutamylaminecyclotransferase
MSIKIENNSNRASTTTLIFTYGTLKRGFSNHVLMQDLIKTRDVVFNGIYRNE